MISVLSVSQHHQHFTAPQYLWLAEVRWQTGLDRPLSPIPRLLEPHSRRASSATPFDHQDCAKIHQMVWWKRTVTNKNTTSLIISKTTTSYWLLFVGSDLSMLQWHLLTAAPIPGVPWAPHRSLVQGLEVNLVKGCERMWKVESKRRKTYGVAALDCSYWGIWLHLSFFRPGQT